jgi:hypothetical protein
MAYLGDTEASSFPKTQVGHSTVDAFGNSRHSRSAQFQIGNVPAALKLPAAIISLRKSTHLPVGSCVSVLGGLGQLRITEEHAHETCSQPSAIGASLPGAKHILELDGFII